MCLAIVALGAHPRYAVVVAANRDEYHARAAASAHWWSEGWLAGRDLVANGTWLGVTREGRWALVTNVREPGRHDPSAPSRGALVPRLLSDTAPMHACLAGIIEATGAHNGFNLVAGTDREAHWGSNRVAGSQSLPPGVYGLSNATLDTPWPKVRRTKAGVTAWCARGEAKVEALFALLEDRAVAADEELPSTGIGIERERLLSPPFIVSHEYGTRCSTVLAIGHDGETRFIERAYDAAGHATGVVDERFAIDR